MTRTLPLLMLVLPTLVSCVESTDDKATSATTETDSSTPDDDNAGGDGADGGGDGSDGEDGGDNCDVSLVGHTPADGSINVSLDTDVVLQFSGSVETAPGWDVELTPSVSSGVHVDDVEATTITMTTAGLLAHDTDYIVDVEVCGTPSAFTFRTVSAEDEVDPLEVDNTELIGNTYVLDLAAAEWHEPAGLGAILGTIFQDPLLFGITDADETALWPGLATTTTGSGASGVYTVDTLTAIGRTSFDASPVLTTAPTDITLSYSGVSIPVEDLSLRVEFAADAQTLVTAYAEALGDTRTVGAGLGLGSAPDAFCNTAAGLGITCVACADGNPYCMEMELTVHDAPLADGVSL